MHFIRPFVKTRLRKDDMPSKTIKIISAALHVSILIYVGVVFYLASQGGWSFSWSIHLENQILLYALTGVACVTGTLSIFAPRIFKDPQAQVSGDSGAVEPLFFDFSDRITLRIQTITIMRMAFAESVAIFGLVLAMINQSAMVVVPYAVAALLLQILVGGLGSIFRGK